MSGGNLAEKFRTHRFLNGVMVITPRIYSDERGFFFEAYNKEDFQQLGIGEDFVQDNHSCSQKGVIRGLHYQSRFPQGKLVRVLRGSIYDVIVDIRNGSPTYGRYCGVTLSVRDHRMVYIPVGYAHGFLSLEDRTEVQYKTTEFYHPEYDAGILWNDPDVGIDWPLRKYGIERPILSVRDHKLPLLIESVSPFEYHPG